MRRLPFAVDLCLARIGLCCDRLEVDVFFWMIFWPAMGLTDLRCSLVLFDAARTAAALTAASEEAIIHQRRHPTSFRSPVNTLDGLDRARAVYNTVG